MGSGEISIAVSFALDQIHCRRSAQPPAGISSGLSHVVAGIKGINSTILGRTLAAAVIGGTASALTGGRFANGAITSAFVHLVNAEVVRPFDAAFETVLAGGAVHMEDNTNGFGVAAPDYAAYAAGAAVGVLAKSAMTVGENWAVGKFFRGLNWIGGKVSGAFRSLTAPAAKSGASRLNIFGTGEARGFLDVSTNATFANGRPLTSALGNGSASSIFIRNPPISGRNTIPEILRLSQPGTRVTLMQPAGGFQGQALIDAFGSRATVNFMGTFPSQTGVDMTILRMTAGGHL
jgi:hypothetical protein